MGSGHCCQGPGQGVILCFEIPLFTATDKPLPGPLSRAQLQMHNSPCWEPRWRGIGAVVVLW